MGVVKGMIPSNFKKTKVTGFLVASQASQSKERKKQNKERKHKSRGGD